MTAVLTLTVNPSIDLGAATEKVMPTRKLRCDAVQRDPGGGGVNVARVICHLGGDCRALFTAGGSPGELLGRLLQAEGIPGEAIAIADDTREDFTVLERASGEQFRFVLPGPTLQGDEIERLLRRTDESLRQYRPAWLVASGSLPPGAPADLYKHVGALARAHDARYVVDTSGPALAAAVDVGGLFLIKPSLRELRELTRVSAQDDPDGRNAALDLVRRGGVRHVALTLGDAGALLINDDGVFKATAPTVAVASTIGAGDSFLGGLLWRLAEGDDVVTAFRYGVAAGTAAVMNAGTAHCRREDVEALFPQITVAKQ